MGRENLVWRGSRRLRAPRSSGSDCCGDMPQPRSGWPAAVVRRAFKALRVGGHHRHVPTVALSVSWLLHPALSAVSWVASAGAAAGAAGGAALPARAGSTHAAAVQSRLCVDFALACFRPCRRGRRPRSARRRGAPRAGASCCCVLESDGRRSCIRTQLTHSSMSSRVLEEYREFRGKIPDGINPLRNSKPLIYVPSANGSDPPYATYICTSTVHVQVLQYLTD